ncbi:MAG: D-alanine--D-alanine ligase family protein [Acutalibacteraceae bacterium]|nr:D-alanine--D-alanine ligase family protein [Acutalibacteraceae bacterium]
MKINLAVFFGCRSVEHEVSIISAVQAMASMDREKYNIIPVYVTKDGEMVTGDCLTDIESFKDIPALLKKCIPVTFLKKDGKVVMSHIKKGIFQKNSEVNIDVAFPIVHGTNCEDGTMQGFFEFLDLPYVGCDIVSSAVGMDKAVFKDVLKRFSLPVLDCITFYARQYAQDKESIVDGIIEKIGLPAIVKPINLGSSVGISKAKDKTELMDSIDLAVSFADKVLVERAVTGLREINCSVLGDSDECIASVCEEPFMTDEILSYEDKYTQGAKKTGASKGMASLSRKIPADLSEEKTEEIRSLACEIFKALGCCGVVRIDFMIDTETDTIYANEINTIPGSLSFYLWEPTGVPYKELLDRMISLAFRRQRKKEELTFTIDTNILAGVKLGGTKGSKGSKI